MAHVPLVDEPKGIIARLSFGYAKRRFGRMIEPMAAAAHHPGVLVAVGALETTAQIGLKKLDPTLRWLAIQAAAGTIGCSWCTDYAYYEGMNEGIDSAKVRAAGQWRDSDLFDDRERAVLEYAEKASGSPAEVSDELAARLRRLLQRRRDRRAGGLGRARELAVAVQRRIGPAQPGFLGHL